MFAFRAAGVSWDEGRWATPELPPASCRRRTGRSESGRRGGERILPGVLQSSLSEPEGVPLTSRNEPRSGDEALRDRMARLSMASHELRAPLAGIKGTAAAVLESSQDVHRAEMLQFFRIVDVQALGGIMRDAFRDFVITTGAAVLAVLFAVTGAPAQQSPNGPVKKRMSLDVPMPAEAGADVQVTLTWDVDSDLDLAVVEPSGEYIHYGNPTSRTGGTLDIDSNADCNIDGKRVENIRWPPGEAPEGQYRVELAQYSSCGTSRSNYTVRIVNGASVQTSGEPSAANAPSLRLPHSPAESATRPAPSNRRKPSA